MCVEDLEAGSEARERVYPYVITTLPNGSYLNGENRLNLVDDLSYVLLLIDAGANTPRRLPQARQGRQGSRTLSPCLPVGGGEPAGELVGVAGGRGVLLLSLCEHRAAAVEAVSHVGLVIGQGA